MSFGFCGRLFLAVLLNVVIVGARPLVRHIRSANEFDRLIAKHATVTGLPVIADFYSDGCGPCRMMAPIFKKLAKEKLDNAVFVKIDTNQVHQLSSRYGVRSIPTFIFFHDGKKVTEFSGAGEAQLRQLTDQVIRQAEYENVKITPESLLDYYKEKDGSKTAEAVQSIHDKCVQKMKGTKVDTDECVGAAARKLAKSLKKKYGSSPELTSRFAEEDRKSSSSETESNKSKNNKEKSSTRKQGGNADKPNLHLATKEELEKELEKRLEAEMEAQINEEEDDNAEFEHGWSPGDFPERITIIGGGPAGMAAAIYAARSGLTPVVVAPPMGGQLQGKGVDVENYPGMINVTGPAVVATMREQASAFGAVFEAELVEKIDASSRPFKVITNSSVIETHAIIVSTGAESNWLDIPGEYEMRGGGVSSCATCDGHFFRDTDVVVVGGGDTAMEEALVLARTSKSVTVIHRRDSFRASKILAQRVTDHPSISIEWNTTVTEVLGESTPEGDKKMVTGLVLTDVNTKATRKISCNALFVAIGHTPITSFLQSIDGIEFDEMHPGYLKTIGGSTKTSVPGIFAAGDVADSIYRQAITSAGSGAAAALDAERWLSEEGLGNEAAEFEAELLRELMEDSSFVRGESENDVYNAYADDSISARGYKESMGSDL